MAFLADANFLFGLFLKMAMTASIVVAASFIVERSGPFIGAMIASLPTAGGAAYIILAMEHPPSFIAASAVASMTANIVVAIFALAYAILAQRNNLAVSLGGALLVWFGCAAAIGLVAWTPLMASIATAVAFTITILASRRFRTEGTGRKIAATRKEIAWRTLIVSVFVAGVTTLSHAIGSFASGLFAFFPIAMSSFFVILHTRLGGPAAASVAAHVQAPLIGLGLGLLAVHYLAETAGVWWSLLVGLLVCLAWNMLLWLVRNARQRAAA
jgi:uncharacterized membrane protein (GlpM family)